MEPSSSSRYNSGANTNGASSTEQMLRNLSMTGSGPSGSCALATAVQNSSAMRRIQQQQQQQRQQQLSQQQSSSNGNGGGAAFVGRVRRHGSVDGSPTAGFGQSRLQAMPAISHPVRRSSFNAAPHSNGNNRSNNSRAALAAAVGAEQQHSSSSSSSSSSSQSRVNRQGDVGNAAGSSLGRSQGQPLSRGDVENRPSRRLGRPRIAIRGNSRESLNDNGVPRPEELLWEQGSIISEPGSASRSGRNFSHSLDLARDRPLRPLIDDEEDLIFQLEDAFPLRPIQSEQGISRHLWTPEGADVNDVSSVTSAQTFAGAFRQSHSGEGFHPRIRPSERPDSSESILTRVTELSGTGRDGFPVSRNRPGNPMARVLVGKQTKRKQQPTAVHGRRAIRPGGDSSSRGSSAGGAGGTESGYSSLASSLESGGIAIAVRGRPRSGSTSSNAGTPIKPSPPNFFNPFGRSSKRTRASRPTTNPSSHAGLMPSPVDLRHDLRKASASEFSGFGGASRSDSPGRSSALRALPFSASVPVSPDLTGRSGDDISVDRAGVGSMAAISVPAAAASGRVAGRAAAAAAAVSSDAAVSISVSSAGVDPHGARSRHSSGALAPSHMRFRRPSASPGQGRPRYGSAVRPTPIRNSVSIASPSAATVTSGGFSFSASSATPPAHMIGSLSSPARKSELGSLASAFGDGSASGSPAKFRRNRIQSAASGTSLLGAAFNFQAGTPDGTTITAPKSRRSMISISPAGPRNAALRHLGR